MTINATGMMKGGYEIINQTLNMPQNKMEATKKLTQEVVGGALQKTMDLNQKMLGINTQSTINQNTMTQQSNLINLFA